MAAVTSWRKRLQSLPFPPREKGAIIQRLFWRKGGEESIQNFFDACIECGGEEALIHALQGVLQGAADVTETVKKRVRIFTPQVQGEEVVPVAKWFTLTEARFDRFLPMGGYLVPLKGEHPDTDAEAVLLFGDLIEGESYVLGDYCGTPMRVKALENFNASEMQACEEELAAAMVRELRAHGYAENPISRTDLRIHCQGSAEEQEFDAILLDGEHRAFIGSAKHVAHGTSEVEDMLRNVRILATRAHDIQQYPSYAPFQGRALGCCIRLDTIKEAHQQAVKHLCFRKGIGLFQRSGAALSMQHISFPGPLSLEPGFINMVVREIRRLAR